MNTAPPHVEVHSLAWPNADPRIASAQSSVFASFGIPLVLHSLAVDHGAWMDAVLAASSAEVIVFVDNDCIPLDRHVIYESVLYAIRTNGFIGIAQAANHIDAGGHIYAGPPFLVVSRDGIRGLERTIGAPFSFRATRRSDVGQELTRLAEEHCLPFSLIYPTSWERLPLGRTAPWRLGTKGYFGVGTIYGRRIFHLFEGRNRENIDLFEDVCKKVVLGVFSGCMAYPSDCAHTLQDGAVALGDGKMIRHPQSQPTPPLPSAQKSSDKLFWHRYDEFYEAFLHRIPHEEVFDICEVGVFKSDSIRYWRTRFPHARITGIDLHIDRDWYTDPHVRYVQADQGNAIRLTELLAGLPNPRLLIDDGSHLPQHQILFLKVALERYATSSEDHKFPRIVIVEDIQTSLTHSLNARDPDVAGVHRHALQSPYDTLLTATNCLGLLLCAKHFRDGGGSDPQNAIDSILSKRPLDQDSQAVLDRIMRLLFAAADIKIFRRAELPLRCYRCDSTSFDFLTLTCSHCGTDAYKHDDSMTAAILV